LETPTYQHHEVKYVTSATNKQLTEEKQTTPKTLSLNFNKVSRTRQLSGHNYDNLLLSKGRMDKSSTNSNVRNNTPGQNKNVDAYVSEKMNKVSSERSDNLLYSSNYNNPSKLNNYLANNPNKKVSSGSTNNFSENSHRMLSSFSVKGGSNSQVKINFSSNQTNQANQSNNQRVSSSRVGSSNIGITGSGSSGNTGKTGLDQKGKPINLNNYFTAEPKGSISTKNYSSSKPKDNNILSPDKNKKTPTPIHKKMKSNDFFSNNYLTTNNSNHNMNQFLQKISSTRNIGFGDKVKKSQFSPHKTSSIKIKKI